MQGQQSLNMAFRFANDIENRRDLDTFLRGIALLSDLLSC